MKSWKLYIIVALSSLICYACNEHDTMDDNVFVGEMAPQLDWSPASSSIPAGENMSFSVTYYTTGSSNVSHLELWYSVMQTISTEIKCSWVTSQVYVKSSTATEQIRISQKIAEYQHENSSWDQNSRAFLYSSSFPVSSTLSSVTYSNPSTFGAEDSLKVENYFSSTFMAEFKEELYQQMKFQDFKNMYLGLSLLDDFSQFTDSTFNDNTQLWEYHFHKDASGNISIPQQIVDIYQVIPFSSLIYDRSKDNYSITYKKNYKLGANVKVIDDDGNIGIGRETEISLN